MKLHIGGREPHPDWKILDIEARPEVDFIGNAADLSQFPDESISAIYSSHVLEHFHYGLNYELSLVLLEWYRVLAPTGELMISVPNLETLCWLYCDPKSTKEDRFALMRMIFGGQVNEYDVHKAGLDPYILWDFLKDAGFKKMQLVDEFHLFQDCSALRWKGQLISLNVVVTK